MSSFINNGKFKTNPMLKSPKTERMPRIDQLKEYTRHSITMNQPSYCHNSNSLLLFDLLVGVIFIH